ncbi:hypothetical protein [Streptomyces sp. R35]|uniref:Uncharacterized protein n=1 Tax=Streptomyces sp. R35 TaxID=3238630 RepID=A0AB39SMB0_9ACTN
MAATDLAVAKRYFTSFGETREGGTGTWTDDKAFLGKTADEDTRLTGVLAITPHAGAGPSMSS